MGDCPELFNRLFGRSSNLTNAQILDDWPRKLYYIVQYEFKNPMVARKIMGMLLNENEDYHELYKEIVRDHYRFLNPALNVDVAELRSIEGRVAEFYEILMAVKGAILEAANSGPLNLERYVVRGASGTRLRNNNVNTNVSNQPLERQANKTNADRFEELLEQAKYITLDEETNPQGIVINLEELKKSAKFLEQLIELGKRVRGPSDRKVVKKMMTYADLRATIMRAGSTTAAVRLEVERLFEDAVNAAAETGDVNLHVEAINALAVFLSNYGSPDYKARTIEQYKKVYEIAKEAGNAIKPRNKYAVSLNYINVLSDYVLRSGTPDQLFEADNAMGEVIATMPDDQNIINLLPRYATIKMRAALNVADLKARQKMFNDAFKVMIRVKEVIKDEELKQKIKASFLQTTTQAIGAAIQSQRPTMFDEVKYLSSGVKYFVTDTEKEKQLIDQFIADHQGLQNFQAAKRAALKESLKQKTRRG
jgi:hypothetical protein